MAATLGRWITVETIVLLDVWGADSIQSQLDSMIRNKLDYQKVASDIAELGYKRTWQQCKTKIKNLVQKYRNVSKNLCVLEVCYGEVHVLTLYFAQIRSKTTRACWGTMPNHPLSMIISVKYLELELPHLHLLCWKVDGLAVEMPWMLQT